MALTAKKLAFIDYYKSKECAGNASKAAILAGYSPINVNRSASRLLHDVDIRSHLDKFKSERKEKYSKDNFVDEAWNKFEAVEDESPNKPRFLEIAAKIVGHIGTNNQPQVIHQTLNVNVSGMNLDQLRDYTRRMIAES